MNAMLHMILFLGVSAVINPSPEQAVVKHDISVYLPVAGEVAGWNPVNTSRMFAGEELYALIDGGASLFYEYGFEQVVTQTYENADSQSVDLEIYEMTDPSAAYGIYTISAGALGDDVDIGNEGMVAEYYMYFWKGDFFVTLTASDAGESAAQGILAIASWVDEKILSRGSRPSLCNLMMIEGETPSRLYYLRGVLALSSVYNFAFEDIFGLQEGVVGNFEKYKCFIFKYGDMKEGRHWFRSARDALKQDERYGDFQTNDDECSMTDEIGVVVHLKTLHNYILVYVGTPDTDPRSIFYKIENNLR
jgi:hypothetical protein